MQGVSKIFSSNVIAFRREISYGQSQADRLGMVLNSAFLQESLFNIVRLALTGGVCRHIVLCKGNRQKILDYGIRRNGWRLARMLQRFPAPSASAEMASSARTFLGEDRLGIGLPQFQAGSQKRSAAGWNSRSLSAYAV